MTVDELVEDARSRIQRATAAEAGRAQRDGAIIVDLRCPDERRRTGVIPGSIAIARSVLEWRADPRSEWRDERIAKPEERLILVCEEGYSSSIAADSVRRLGFRRAGDLDGGMAAWINAGLPTSPATD